MVKTLKQCITDMYLESPWAKVSHISDVEDSNIERHPPKGKEDQGNWVFKKADKEAGQEAGEGEEADPSIAQPYRHSCRLSNPPCCVGLE